MRNINIIISIFLGFHLPAQNLEKLEMANPIEYKVIKIDSINDYYLIFVQSNEGKKKVISRMDSIACQNIYEGHVYSLTLNDVFPFSMSYSNKVISGTVFEIDDEWGSNIYKANELMGLCYETDKRKLERYQQWVNQQEAFESWMYLLWVEDKNAKGLTFSQFVANNYIAELKPNYKIPVYAIDIDGNVERGKISRYINTTEGDFECRVYFEKGGFLLIKKSCKNTSERAEIFGWIEKKYLKGETGR